MFKMSMQHVSMLDRSQVLPLTAEQLGTATQRDPVLSWVVQYTKSGWPTAVDPQLKPFQRRQHELTVEANCLMLGMRVVIPAKFQRHILRELHHSVSGELIVSKYVAESITMIAGRFGHEGLCQLRTELKKLQCEIGYIANTDQWCDVEWVRK